MIRVSAPNENNHIMEKRMNDECADDERYIYIYNMQSIQDGNTLYMIGGYGWDSIMSDFTTFNTLTAIDVNNTIDAIINNQPIAPFIRQYNNTNLAISGGELEKLNNEYYLFFGHFFGGRYSNSSSPLFVQEYSNRIKKFTIL